MHSIKQLGDTLGISPNQVRTRLNLLRPWFDQFTRRGEKNKILVDDSGLEVLKHFRQLERKDDSLQIVASEIKGEQDRQSKPPVKRENNLVQTDLIEEKERQIKRLEEENGYLRNKLDEKDRQIQQLLPAATDGPSIWDKIASRLDKLFGIN